MNTIISTQAPNHSSRTFTIRNFDNGKVYAKYRTLPMSKKEFESALYWTQGDWRQFMKTDEYSKVK